MLTAPYWDTVTEGIRVDSRAMQKELQTDVNWVVRTDGLMDESKDASRGQR